MEPKHPRPAPAQAQERAGERPLQLPLRAAQWHTSGEAGTEKEEEEIKLCTEQTPACDKEPSSVGKCYSASNLGQLISSLQNLCALHSQNHLLSGREGGVGEIELSALKRRQSFLVLFSLRFFEAGSQAAVTPGLEPSGILGEHKLPPCAQLQWKAELRRYQFSSRGGLSGFKIYLLVPKKTNKQTKILQI